MISRRVGSPGSATTTARGRCRIYDTAQAANEYTLPTLTKLVPLPHILFGTDYPFARGETVTKGLTAFTFSPTDVRAIAARMRSRCSRGCDNSNRSCPGEPA